MPDKDLDQTFMSDMSTLLAKVDLTPAQRRVLMSNIDAVYKQYLGIVVQAVFDELFDSIDERLDQVLNGVRTRVDAAYVDSLAVLSPEG